MAFAGTAIGGAPHDDGARAGAARRAGRRAARVRRRLGLRVAQAHADYHGALQWAVEVRPIIHETYDGLHHTASRTLREMAGMHAARHSSSAGGRRASTFRRFPASASRVRWQRGSPPSSATAC
eukprot:1008098-Prymnesium_polylepis.1